MTTALMDRLTHHCHIVETGNESFRFRHSTNMARGDTLGVSKQGAAAMRQQTRQQIETATCSVGRFGLRLSRPTEHVISSINEGDRHSKPLYLSTADFFGYRLSSLVKFQSAQMINIQSARTVILENRETTTGHKTIRLIEIKPIVLFFDRPLTGYFI
jgi:hypothetical protein